MSDKWVRIPGFNFYEASSAGRIRSWKRSGGVRDVPKLMAISCKKNGYAQVSIVNDGAVIKNCLVHRLIAMAFGLNRNDGCDLVLHRNGSRTDNRPENLYWGTAAENTQDAIRHGTFCTRGSNNCKAKLTESDVLEIRAKIKRGDIGCRIADEYSVSVSLISCIKLRKCWAWL